MCLPKFDMFIKVNNFKLFWEPHKLFISSWLFFFFFFFKKKFFFFSEKRFVFLISGLKFTLSNVTSFIADNLSGLKKLYAGLLVRKKRLL